MILNGLPWKRTEIILSFLRLHPSLEYDIYLSLSDSLLCIIGSRFIHIFRNNSINNEQTESKQNRHPVVDVTGDESKV